MSAERKDEIWATVDVSFGEGKKHICIEDHDSFTLHTTRREADIQVERDLSSGVKMVALLKLEAMYEAAPIDVRKVSLAPLATTGEG